MQRKDKVIRSLTPYVFLTPSILGVMYFILFPFLDSVRRSFSEVMGNHYVGIKYYSTVINNEAFKLAISNTLRFMLICIPLLLMISLFLAMVLNTILDGWPVFKTIFLVPMAIPVASIVILWKYIFSAPGLLNSIRGYFELASVDFMNTKYAFTVLVISYIWKNVGYDMILWIAALNNIPVSYYEAAKVDGASSIQSFINITLPLLSPTTFTIAVLSILNSFKVFREAYLVAGDYPHESIYLMQHLFNNWFITLDIQRLCAASVLLALIIIFIIILLRVIIR